MNQETKTWKQLVPGDKIWIVAPVESDNAISPNFQECSVIQSKPIVNRYDNQIVYWFIKFKYTTPDAHRKRAYLNISMNLADTVSVYRINGKYGRSNMELGDVIAAVNPEYLKLKFNQLIVERLVKNDMEIQKLERTREMLRKAYIK